MFRQRRSISILNNLITGIILITIGLVVAIKNVTIYTKVVRLLVYAFIIFGLSQLLNFLLNKKIVRNKQFLFKIIVNIVLGFTFLLFPKFPISLMPVIFSIYLLFNSVVKYINYALLKEVKLKSRFKEFFFGTLFLVFSLFFMLYPTKKISIFVTLIGFYCVVLGISRLYEFLIDILSEKFKLKFKKKMRITLPLFFEVFAPKEALKHINKYIEELTREDKNNKESDLKIFIHLSKYGFNQFGHMDIMFENKIYSYGNYDRSSRSLFTALGDGVLFELKNKEKYINFCITNSRKTIVEYGIRLTDSQKIKLKRELDNIFKDAYEWIPEVVRAKNKNEYNDYTSKLYKNTKAKFYKFKKGIYKKYFVLGVNCTYFADMLMRNSVFEVLKLVGVISPGTYYEYLEENYRKKNSNVVSKMIYNKEI